MLANISPVITTHTTTSATSQSNRLFAPPSSEVNKSSFHAPVEEALHRMHKAKKRLLATREEERESLLASGKDKHGKTNSTSDGVLCGGLRRRGHMTTETRVTPFPLLVLLAFLLVLRYSQARVVAMLSRSKTIAWYRPTKSSQRDV